jgi:hypothetical protein
VVATSVATPSALSMDTNCTSWISPASTTASVAGAIGDRFKVAIGGGFPACNVTFTASGASGIVTPNSGRITTTYFTIVGPGSFTIIGGTAPLTIIVSVNATDVSDPESSPPDLFQSIELVTVSSCARVDRPDLDWSGVSSGSWTQSWQMWANAGKGGPVCNRVLWYDQSAARWSSATR